jgi:EH domain-containing protein 1
MEGLGVLMAKKKHSSKSSDPNMNGSPAADTSLTAHWFSSKSSKKISLSSVTSIVDGLKRLYIQKLKPLEVAYRFNDFVSPLLVSWALLIGAPMALFKFQILLNSKLYLTIELVTCFFS